MKQLFIENRQFVIFTVVNINISKITLHNNKSLKVLSLTVMKILAFCESDFLLFSFLVFSLDYIMIRKEKQPHIATEI